MALKRTPADAAFSDAIREAANWTCQRCGIVSLTGQMTGKDQSMHCSHISSRKFLTTRTYVQNALCLCASCHSKMGDRPLEHAGLVEDIHGCVNVALLECREQRVDVKYSKKDKAAIAKHYRDEVARIRKRRMDGDQGFIEVYNYD